MGKHHGMSKTITYNSWAKMKERCGNSNNDYYSYYRENNIRVCKRWKNSFLSFLEDMGERPSKKYSIDRIDNNKGYYKENCRWATRSEQQCNKRTTGCTHAFYIIKFKDHWRLTIKYKGKTIKLKYYVDFQEAIKDANEFVNSNNIKPL